MQTAYAFSNSPELWSVTALEKTKRMSSTKPSFLRDGMLK